MANYARTELADLVTQAQWTTLGIAQDEPLLRSSLHHSPLSLRLKQDIKLLRGWPERPHHPSNSTSNSTPARDASTPPRTPARRQATSGSGAA